jgi:hypothetical protein
MTRTTRSGWRCGGLSIAVLLALAGLSGCGGAEASGAGTPAPDATGFTAAAAGEVLGTFDRVDSAASSAGDLTALATLETNPALNASVASVHRAKAGNRSQPPFQHRDPTFAIPSAAPSCFLAVATIASTGSELTRTDVSQFVRFDDGAWKLSHNIQIGAADAQAVRALGGRPAVAATSAVDETRRLALATEIFARTTATQTPDTSLVTTSTLLDQQFAAGFRIYRQQMATAGMAVDRSSGGADWSSCALSGDAGTVAFLTLHVTDTIRPTPGGPARATLSAQSPDVIGLGLREAATGTLITVTRVQVVLILIPPAGPATVLGLSDAPTALTASP